MDLPSNVLAQVTPVSVSAGDVGFGPLSPNRYGLPGSAVALQITNGLVFYGLLLCLVGLVLSAGLWAVGSFANNNQSVNGKRGFLTCAACALAIGAAYFLVRWFYGAGTTVN